MTDETASAEAGNAAESLTGAAALLAAETADTGATTVEAAAAPDKLVTDAARAEWLKTLPDDASRAMAETKGWGSHADILKSYINAEKLIGGDKIAAPKGPDDAEGMARLHKALGMPDAPEGYQLPVPDGADPAFAKAIAPIFHKAGLGARQAEVLAEGWSAMQAQAAQAAAQARKVKGDQDMNELHSEWGDKFQSNMELSSRAAKQFGLDGQTLQAIENAIGTKKIMTLLNKIGSGLAEDSFEAGDGRATTFKLTPAAARARIDTLKTDVAWSARFLAGGADEKAEWNRLQLAANP